MPIQIAAFHRAYEVARAAGLEPALRHLANSAAALVVPEARLDLVRVGIAAYGIDPAPGIAARAGVTLRPVMTLRAQLVNVKPIPAGAGVSYGWTWMAPRPTTVGLVPLGYGDGIPRHASNRASVGWSGRLGSDPRPGLHGPVRRRPGRPGAGRARGRGGDLRCGRQGAPTAADWADWCGTIGYEIVTRVGSRVPRRYLNASPEDS